MDDKIYSECLHYWLNSNGNQPFWTELAKKYKYPSAESLRSSFKRERKRRGDAKVGTEPVQLNNNFPTVAVMDIETLPMIGMMWNLYNVDFYPEQVLEDTCFLSWAGKYLYNDTMYSDILTPEEAKTRNPARITHSAFEFMKQADIIIGHNFKAYDGKTLNNNLLMYAKPLKYRVIDTLEIAKNNFRFASNKLAFINKKLGIREKVTNEGFMLWRNCSEGDSVALSVMLEYNCGDILSTEELFWKVQPYMTNMPNFSIYNENKISPSCTCGSIDISREEKDWYTNSARYEKFRCNTCGALMRGKKNLLVKEEREQLLVRL